MLYNDMFEMSVIIKVIVYLRFRENLNLILGCRFN